MQLDPQLFSKPQPTSWEEIFDVWQKREANIPGWKEHWEEQGYKTWDAWRKATHAAIFEKKDLQWKYFKIRDPLMSVPNFRIGTFRGWNQTYAEGKQSPTFADVADNPKLAENEKVQAIMADFPKETEIIGIVVGGEIVVVEGMHRCSAIALAAKEGRAIDTEMTIALAEYPGKEVPKFGLSK